MMVNNYKGQTEKGILERFNSKTEEEEAISYDDEDSKIVKEQCISDIEDD
jgi:hypothetical protein